MMGIVESFNVSVACAIILAEAQRQRQAKGFYDHPRLSETHRQQKKARHLGGFVGLKPLGV